MAVIPSAYNDAKWSHATDITNMGQINYYFLQ